MQNPRADDLLSSTAVRARYGNVTAMTIWRWENDPKLNFPKSKVINNRKYKRRSDLDTWDAARPDRAAQPPCARKHAVAA